MANFNAHGDRGMMWVVQFSSALSLGILAALLYSVKAVNPEIRFKVSVATWVAFALAAVLSVLFWHVVFKLNRGLAEGHNEGQQGHKAALWFLATALGISLVFAFAYPLKDFSSEKVWDIGFGALLAVTFLSVLGIIFWRVVCYLEQDHRSERG
jgi:hypothetical protein